MAKESKPKIEVDLDDLEGLLSLELADGDMGYYCNITYSDGRPNHVKTEREEGHNECLSEFHEKRFRIWFWFEKFPAEYKSFCYKLMMDEKLRLNVPANKEEPITMWLLCNDVFAPAADGQDITMEQIPEMIKCFEESPEYGDLLWIARQRKCTVWAKARNWMDAESIKLFDACQIPF